MSRVERLTPLGMVRIADALVNVCGKPVDPGIIALARAEDDASLEVLIDLLEERCLDVDGLFVRKAVDGSSFVRKALLEQIAPPIVVEDGGRFFRDHLLFDGERVAYEDFTLTHAPVPSLHDVFLSGHGRVAVQAPDMLRVRFAYDYPPSHGVRQVRRVSLQGQEYEVLSHDRSYDAGGWEEHTFALQRIGRSPARAGD